MTAGPDPADPGEFAPAKVNLCLHVTGRRADGYHLLDSLVVFAGVGDRISLAQGAGLTLAVTGPEAAGLGFPPPDVANIPFPGSSATVLAGAAAPVAVPKAGQAADDNLALRAARAMGETDAALTLWKALPVASGIGGGSADAAATLRLLRRLTGRALPDPATVLALGADVPVCLAGRPVRMSGIGEDLAALPPLPPMACILVNPRLPVPTPQVFAALASRENPPLPPLPAGALASAPDFAAWLAARTRNDLVAPALAVLPMLGTVQAALEGLPGCLLARMSGSGGTHFGLFDSLDAATAAARTLRDARPGWWIEAAPVLT